MRHVSCSALFVCLLGSSALIAADGQIDLLPSATATTTISQPGSYVVVANVQMTADAMCIAVNASDVTLDLNGHTLNAFTGTASTLPGISISGDRVTVRNGKVRGFNIGIRVGVINPFPLAPNPAPATHVSRMHVTASGQRGVVISSGSIGSVIQDSVFEDSTSDHIMVDANFVKVLNNTTRGTGTGLSFTANANNALVVGNNVGSGSAAGQVSINCIGGADFNHFMNNILDEAPVLPGSCAVAPTGTTQGEFYNWNDAARKPYSNIVFTTQF